MWFRVYRNVICILCISDRLVGKIWDYIRKANVFKNLHFKHLLFTNYEFAKKGVCKNYFNNTMQKWTCYNHVITIILRSVSILYILRIKTLIAKFNKSFSMIQFWNLESFIIFFLLKTKKKNLRWYTHYLHKRRKKMSKNSWKTKV